MSSQRVLIIAAITGCLLAGALLFRATRDSEPVCEGKRLGEWVELLTAGNGSKRAEAEVALRQMGTNALPHLVRMLRTRDSAFKENVRLVASLQTMVNLRLSRAADQRSRALAAFEALGSEARAAIPDLADLLNRGENPMDLGRALAAVGPDAVWPLTQALAHEDGEIRAAAAYGLGLLRAEGRVVVPVLVRGLEDKDYAVRFYAARSLFHLHA
jgi:HEAT repeat protein